MTSSAPRGVARARARAPAAWRRPRSSVMFAKRSINLENLPYFLAFDLEGSGKPGNPKECGKLKKPGNP